MGRVRTAEYLGGVRIRGERKKESVGAALWGLCGRCVTDDRVGGRKLGGRGVASMGGGNVTNSDGGGPRFKLGRDET